MDNNGVCLSCGKPDHAEGAEFCSNCGFALHSNFCTNEFCNANNGQQFSFPADACYCDLCGAETVYRQNMWIKPKSYKD